MSGFTISGANHHGYRRIFNCGDDPDFRWSKGGRLYSVGDVSYQLLPETRKDGRPGRDEITINGQPVVELDIRSCNLTIFCAMIGEPLDLSADPFSNLSIDRPLAKYWVNASFGAGHLIDRWPQGFVKEYKEDHDGHRPPPVKVVREAVLARLPELKRLNELNAPSPEVLQFLESQIIITTMNRLMDDGIPSLAVHDSLIMPQQHEELAKSYLIESFKKALGVRPAVTAKWTKRT